MKTRAAIVKAAPAADPVQMAVLRNGFASRGGRAA